MKFTYRYRDPTGSAKSAVLEADNREDAFTKLKGLGIQPLSLVSGEVIVDSKKKSVPGIAKGTIAGLVVVVVALTAWFTFDVPKAVENTNEIRKLAKPKIVTPKRIAMNMVPAKVDPRAPYAHQADGLVPVPAPTGAVIQVRSTRQMRTLEDGTQVPVSKSIFTNGFERALSTLTNPGGMAIPFSYAIRRFSEEEIRRILATPMKYNFEDSDDALRRKFAVQQLKDEFQGYLKDGMTMKEAISAIDHEVRLKNRAFNMSRAGLAEAIRSGDGATVRAFVAEQNVELEKLGMKKLSVPERFREIEGTPQKGN